MNQLGKVGMRGRKHFSWNEATGGGGGIGGSFLDWWIFGGSVWIRVWFCVLDGIFGHLDDNGEEGVEDVGGENLFACFGVVENKNAKQPTDSSSSENTTKVDQKEKNDAHHHKKRVVGIAGYDSSLGAHGPFILAPLRASIMLLAWCSAISFMARTHDELTNYLTNVDVTTKGELHELILRGSVYILQGIHSILSIDSSNASDSDSFLHTLLPTIIYASMYIIILEITFFTLGKVFAIFQIYAPKGVSHPGGPRSHKIVRVPQWTKDQQHVMPKELIQNNGGKWRCAVAHDAHRDTIAKFSNIRSDIDEKEAKKEAENVPDLLTGEPFGRQLWTLLETQTRTKEGGETEDDLEDVLRKEFMDSTITEKEEQAPKTPKKQQPNFGELLQSLWSPNEKEEETKITESKIEFGNLVQNLASGGRPPFAFDPSKNPNSCDQIFRAQMIATYLEQNDGKLPEDIAYLQQQQQISSKKSLSPSNANPPKTAMDAAKRGVAFYSLLQSSDGHWAGDYGGPHFLLPGLVVAWYVWNPFYDWISYRIGVLTRTFSTS